jgi:tetratricopeptide (TPR) repeat protein/TolB-like protein
MEDDELVMNLVDEVLGNPSTVDREAFARNLCGSDSLLFEKVWGYVQWDEHMKNFLVQPLYRLSSEEPQLEPGQILENRFRILRRVAAGGMGVVYEANDEKLGRRIAVKCAKAGFDGRLPPEVRLASEINHRNVCKTWEIHTGSGPDGEFDFLTMEFIEGQTLAERLRDGPIPRKLARDIANQICAGLAEAHRQKVIHGDLKSNNILLSEGPEGIRAAITDFGLARSWMSQAPALSSGDAGGTLDYMAPELLQHVRPSFESDLYALGVILHEMASGHTPFSRNTPPEDRLTRQPERLRHPWGAIIARCLEPEPGRRCASASEVAAALVPFPWLKWSSVAVAVACAIAIVVIGFRIGSAPRDPVRLAFLPLVTDTDSKSLGDGLLQDTADRLRAVKEGRRKLTIIPARDAVHNKVDTPGKAAAMLGATHLLTGTLRSKDDRVIVHASLIDARTALLDKDWDAEYRRSELGIIPVALAGVVTGTLRLPPLAYTATVNAAAYPDFAAGVGLLQRDSADASLPFLKRAVQADAGSPLTHARLAEAQALKYSATLSQNWLVDAKTSLHEAEQRNPDLALVWVVSGRINEYQGFYEAAESDLKRALEIDARDGDAWRRLGRVYVKNNHFSSAVGAFRRAIEVQSDYFLNYEDLCGVYTEQAQYDDAVPQCRKVVQLAPDLSYAHWGLAVALFCLGSYEEADSEFLLAIQLDPASATAVFSRAFALTSRGHPMEAIPLFEKAIAMGPVTHLMYCGLGTTYRLAGAPAKAKNAYGEGLVFAERALEKNPRDAVTKAQLAYLCARLGQVSRAKSEAAQAGQLASDSVEVAWWIALTWEALGDQEHAVTVLQNLPDATIRRISREADLADFRKSSRFLQLMASRHIQ